MTCHKNKLCVQSHHTVICKICWQKLATLLGCLFEGENRSGQLSKVLQSPNIFPYNIILKFFHIDKEKLSGDMNPLHFRGLLISIDAIISLSFVRLLSALTLRPTNQRTRMIWQMTKPLMISLDTQTFAFLSGDETERFIFTF